MSRTMWVVSMLGLGMLCGICASCEKSKDVEQVELDSLPYLQETHHPELRHELARLEAERTTPRSARLHLRRAKGRRKIALNDSWKS